MNSISIVMTMDCEPTTTTSHAAATGPRDWAQGERAVRGYLAIAREFGFPVTFFIHPETAIGQAEMWKELEAEGATLGLHMHPWKYSMWKHGGAKYFQHYGALSEHEQRDLLTEASNLWADAIGHRPLYFRPGTFSANDAIFRVLDDLGFAGGACSAPGRMMPEMRAIWTGAEPDPHRASAVFRQVKGDLDFVNMPQTMDFSKLLAGRIGRRMYADLRPDIDWHGQYGVEWPVLARNLVDQLLERNPAVPVMGVLAHNHYEYLDNDQPVTNRLRVILAESVKACRDKGIEPVGRNIADIVKAVRALPRESEALVIEGAIFESQGEVPTLKR